jgi:hypothetical protein
MTLNPGDVIATGTPPGVGFSRTPPRYLSPGDTVRVEVERVGSVTNPIVGSREVPTARRTLRVRERHPAAGPVPSVVGRARPRHGVCAGPSTCTVGASRDPNRVGTRPARVRGRLTVRVGTAPRPHLDRAVRRPAPR